MPPIHVIVALAIILAAVVFAAISRERQIFKGIDQFGHLVVAALVFFIGMGIYIGGQEFAKRSLPSAGDVIDFKGHRGVVLDANLKYIELRLENMTVTKIAIREWRGAAQSATVAQAVSDGIK